MNKPLAGVACLLGLGIPLEADEAKKPAPLAEAAREVVAAVRREAERNAKLPDAMKRTGDELTELYIRTAAAAARKLPRETATGGFLIGLGIALDDSTILRNNPVTAGLCKHAESDDERRQRLAVLGAPTMRSRRDLCQHFAVSCALTEVVGASLAEAAGLLKEMRDAHGGTGFSFADMTANLSGIDLATRLKKGDLTLPVLEAKFRVPRFVPDIKGLPEEMQIDEFKRKYGSPEDPRLRQELDRVRERIKALPR